MKKVSLLLIVLLIVSTAVALASPFISSSPDPNHQRYRMRLSQDGTNWGAWVEGQPRDNHVWFDLGSTPAGDYFGEVQAYMQYSLTDSATGTRATVEEWSLASPFVFTIPTGIKGLTIQK
jgi:hypothetical protein